MKLKTLFTSLIFLIFINAKSQSLIETIFYKIEFSNLNESEKQSLIANQKIFKINNKVYEHESLIPTNDRNKFYSEFEITRFLPESGFMSLNENYVRADGGFHYDLCYWNTTKGYKLIALRYFEFATESYDDLEFYKLKDGKIENVDEKDILPKLKFEDLVTIESIEKDGLDKNDLLTIFPKVFELEFKLPENGKNLIVESYAKDYNLNDKEIKILKSFKKYFKKDIILNWHYGSFRL